MTRNTAFAPDWISPPGETIEDLLDERGWSQADLADRLGASRKHVNELVKGKATLSPETATQLASVLGSTPEFWLRMEAGYRARLAALEARGTHTAAIPWLAELPIPHMNKCGWISRHKDKTDVVAECLRFFGVASVEAWRSTYEAPLVAFRASTKLEKKHGAVAAWLRQAERMAEKVRCAPYDPAGFREELHALRALTSEPDPQVFLPQLAERCARRGVAVVIVPAPTGCPASGATKWLTADKALLVLSLRHKSDDHLWFSFFHEGAHLVLHGKKLLFIEGLDGLDDTHEHEANRYAANLLIPPSEASRLIGAPWRAEAVEQLARQWGIAPGIVVGRMQHDKLLPPSHLNDLKVRYQWATLEAADA